MTYRRPPAVGSSSTRSLQSPKTANPLSNRTITSCASCTDPRGSVIKPMTKVPPNRIYTVVTCAILFKFALLLLFLIIFFLRYATGESGMGPAPVFIFGQLLIPRDAFPCVCVPHYYYLFHVCPPSPPPSSLFCGVARSLSLSVFSCLDCLVLLIWLPFLRSLPRRMFFLPFSYYMWFSFVYFSFVCLLFIDFLF